MNIRKTRVNILKEQKDVERFYTFFSVEIFFDTNVIFKDDIDILVETFKKRYKIFRIRIYFESKKLEFCLFKKKRFRSSKEVFTMKNDKSIEELEDFCIKTINEIDKKFIPFEEEVRRGMYNLAYITLKIFMFIYKLGVTGE